MKKIELQYNIVNNQPYSTTSLNIERSLEVLIKAVNTINEVLSDKICGCGTPFKNHGIGRSGYCTEPSKTSDVLYPPSEGISIGTIKLMTEAEIRADERSRLREKFDKVLNEASVCEEIKVMYSIFKDFIQELK